MGVSRPLLETRPKWLAGGPPGNRVQANFARTTLAGLPPAMTASPAVTAPQNIASPHMDKPALRRRIRRARQALSRGYRLDAMRAIARHASRLLKRGKRVGAYLAAGSELDLEILMSVALWRGAEVYLPQIPRRGRRLWFSRLGAADRWYLHPRYRIAEYDGPALRAERLDVLFVPLLAIDDDGYRMGRAAVLRHHAGFSSARAPVRQTLAGGRGLRLPTRRARAARALGHPARLSIDRIRLAPVALSPACR